MILTGTLKNHFVPQPFKEIAFQEVKSMVISNQFDPGKVYSEGGLALQLGIPRKGKSRIILGVQQDREYVLPFADREL